MRGVCFLVHADVTFEAWRRSCVAALNRAENFGDLRRLPQLRDAIVYILGAD